MSFSNVVSLLALSIALGGTSYAALKVTGRDVVNSSLTGRDVRNNTLRGSDIRNGSLGVRDFARGRLPAGPRGPAGPPGPAGAPATRLWANFLAIGELNDKPEAASAPGITATRSAVGEYSVNFPRSVQECGVQLTAGNPAWPEGEVQSTSGYFAAIGRGSPLTPERVDVDVHSYDGKPADWPFSIAVFC